MLAVACAFIMMAQSASAGQTPAIQTPPVWPEPKQWSTGSSTPTLDHLMRVSWHTKGAVSGPLTRSIARFRAAAFPHRSKQPRGTTELAHLSITVANGATDLQLGVSEAYVLTVPVSGNISLSADTQVGVYRGLESLAQLISFDFDTESYRIVGAPVLIEDAPRFPHREILMDSARHFLPVAEVERLLQAMAINKFNTLHWHLVDLQSFPFVAPRAPELAEKGAFSSWEKYTVADVKDVVAFAADLGIRVVVEVDVPGHTSSFCASHPEVCPSPSCGDANALAPDTEATFDLIEKIYADVADATTDHVMHLGGELSALLPAVSSAAALLPASLPPTSLPPPRYDARFVDSSVIRIASNSDGAQSIF